MMNKKIPVLILSFMFICMFAGCTYFQGGYIGHSIDTQVHLSKANYKVLGSATGQSSAKYILGLFGSSEQNLMDQARRDMINKAKITGGPRAVINLTTDIKQTGCLPFIITKTCYVSGEVIEFTNEK
jgi:hypothetical protein